MTWGTSPRRRIQDPEEQLVQKSPHRTCSAGDQDYISQQPSRRTRSLPRGMCLRRGSAGGAAGTHLLPRRNLRGPGAACFLFVGRGDMAAAAAPAAGSGAGRGRWAAATVAAWGGWGGRPRPGNILLQLRQGQLTGRGLVRAVQVRSRPGGAGRTRRELAGGRGRGLSGPPQCGRDPPWPTARPPCGLHGGCQPRWGGGQRPSTGPR